MQNRGMAGFGQTQFDDEIAACIQQCAGVIQQIGHRLCDGGFGNFDFGDDRFHYRFCSQLRSLDLAGSFVTALRIQRIRVASPECSAELAPVTSLLPPAIDIHRDDHAQTDSQQSFLQFAHRETITNIRD